MSGDETRKAFISVRPALERQQTNVSKTVPKVLKMLGSYRENVGQKSGGHCNWVVKVR